MDALFLLANFLSLSDRSLDFFFFNSSFDPGKSLPLHILFSRKMFQGEAKPTFSFFYRC